MNSELSPVGRENELSLMLRSVSGFEHLTQDAILKIIESTEIRTVRRGEQLIAQGDVADKLYIVFRGRFTVYSKKKPIAEILAGEPIGEIAFFAGGKRSASVFAARESEIICLTRSDYQDLICDIPELNSGIIETLARRVAVSSKNAPKIIPRSNKVIALVPAADFIIPDDFVASLSKAMNLHAGWQILGVHDISQLETMSKAEITNHVLKAEAQSEQLVLISQNPDVLPVWNEVILENCDDVFLVGNAQQARHGTVKLSKLEDNLFRAASPTNAQLVILRNTSDIEIKNTANWLERRPISQHHHVSANNSADFQRLARMIQGKANGLVLSGGGALGAAHLGMLKALKENGYFFDIIGGTSVGAAISGLLAMGAEPDQVMEDIQEIFVKKRAMGRFTMPLHSVFDHKHFDRQLIKSVGVRLIEDLPINYFAVATSLTTNNIHVMRYGKLWHAIRASAAVPALLPPFITPDGEVLIDGSLVDNVPINVMRSLKSGANVVCNFQRSSHWRVNATYGSLPNRWTLLSRFLKMKLKNQLKFTASDDGDFPNIANILTRTLAINSRRLLANTPKKSDVFFNFSTMDGMSALDWAMGKQQFDIAYRTLISAFEVLERDQEAGDLTDHERLAMVADIVNLDDDC